jgi:hypothetical protein
MSIKIKPENKGKFTAYKKRTGKTTTEALHSKNVNVRAMANFARMAKRKFKKLEVGGELSDSDILELYSNGGWLDNAASGAVSGAMTGTSISPGWGTLIGAVAGFGLGAIGGSAEEKAKKKAEIANSYKPAIGKERQVYDTVIAEGGGNLKRLSRRTDYKGFPHSQGGINIGIAEVENGESRTGDIVHSEKIKITPEIMMRFGGNVPLKKSDIGRSVSSVLKTRDRKFERRSGDKWNDTARKISQVPFEEMSDDLSKEYNNENIMAGGGAVNTWLGDKGNLSILSSGLGLVQNLVSKPEEVNYPRTQFVATKRTPISTEGGIRKINRTFGNTRERLRRLNPRMYMNNLGNIGALEAETIGDFVSNVQSQNAEIENRANIIDAQSQNAVNKINTQIGIEQENALAANRAARSNAVSSYSANLATQLGIQSADEKRMAASDRASKQYMNILQGYQDIWKDRKNTVEEVPAFQLPTEEFGSVTGNSTLPSAVQFFSPESDEEEEFELGGRITSKVNKLLKRRYKSC